MYSKYPFNCSRILETTENQCTMCGEEIDATRLVDIDDIQPYIEGAAT